MRRHVVRALLLASLTGCDAQAVKALLATNPAVDGKASDAAGTDTNKGPATPSDIAANLLARLAAVDVSAKVGKVARPSGSVFQAPTAGGAGSSVPNGGASLPTGADGSVQAGDPSRLPQPGFAPMPMPEADARPPMASMPAPPLLEDGWQGMHLDFGSKDFGEASLIARKLASVLEDARPFAVGGQLEPNPVWSFAFASAKGGFAQVVVTPDGADLSYVAEQAGAVVPMEASLDLDAVKVSPMEAVAALRARLAEGSLQDMPFADDLFPMAKGEPGAVSGSTGSEPAGDAIISKPVPMMRRVQGEAVVGTVEGGDSTMPSEPISIWGPVPPDSGTDSPSVTMPPMPDLPQPVESVLRELPAGAGWHVTLQKAASGQLIWLVNAYPYEAMGSAIGSGSSDGAYPVTKEAVYRRVQDLAAEGGDMSSEAPMPIDAGAPDAQEGYVGLPAPGDADAEGSIPVYPVRDVPLALPTTTSPSVGVTGPGAPITGWEVRKASYFQPFAAAVDAVSGKVLAAMLPRQVTYYYPMPLYGPPCEDCVFPEPPLAEEPKPQLPTEPVGEDSDPSGDPVVEDPAAEDPLTEEPPTGEPVAEEPAGPDGGEPSPDGLDAGGDAGAVGGAEAGTETGA